MFIGRLTSKFPVSHIKSRNISSATHGQTLNVATPSTETRHNSRTSGKHPAQKSIIRLFVPWWTAARR